MREETTDLEFDFLIVGGGLAGLYAAVCASAFGRCAVVTKQTLVESNSYWAQGGIAAAVGPGDSPVFHGEDTVKAGRGLCNERAVDVLVEEGRERVSDLVGLGMRFDSDDGGFLLGLEGGHSERRVLHAGGDSTGKEMVEFLISFVGRSEAITVFELATVTDVISDGGRCYGAWGYDQGRGSYLRILSPSTILATGGASALYGRTTNPAGASGEGISLAWRAGAEISDMEFVQFHPTVFVGDGGEAFLITEAVRGEGAYLLNGRGERFMDSYSPLGELAPRDVVSRAVHGETASGEDRVYLSLAHLDPDFVRRRFSNIERLCADSGFDLARDRIPVAPAAHYTIGGVRTALSGETSIKGLYACGEVSNTGVHGANRLASNSLLECLVFAKRCVDSAAAGGFSERGGGDFRGYALADPGGGDPGDFPRTARETILRGMNRRLGIVRDGDGMREFLAELGEISERGRGISGWFGFRLGAMVDVCSLVARAALERKESRGAHMRSDYPEEDARYERHIVFRREPGGRGESG